MQLQSLRVSEILRFWIGSHGVSTHEELWEDNGHIMDTEDRPSSNTGVLLGVLVIRLIFKRAAPSE
jgi:hypothetical protein